MIGLLMGMALAAAPPASGEEAAALAAANQLLGRLTGKDPAAMTALTLPAGGATATVAGPDGKTTIRHFTWPDFFANWRAATSQPLLPKLRRRVPNRWRA